MRFTISCEVEAVSASAAIALFAGNAALVAAPVAAPAAVVETLADKVRDFLANDASGYDWRSAKAIGDIIGATESEVESAVNGASDLKSKRSTRGLGLLISLRD